MPETRLMFQRLQLHNWGPYTGHDFALDSGIIDILGDNGSGKSSLIDALRVALGLHRQHYLFDGRRAADYCRKDGNTAYIALTLHNPMRTVTRRMLPGLGDTVTVICRVQKDSSPICQYLLLDGSLPLDEAVEAASRRKWLKPTAYNELWSRAGYEERVRANRVFGIAAPDEVARSDPRRLHGLFTSYASNAEDAAKLVKAQRRIEEASSDLRLVRQELDSVKSQLVVQRRRRKDAQELVDAFAEYRHHERLRNVAAFEEAQEALKRAMRGASELEKRRIDLIAKRDELEVKRAGLLKELEIDEEELRGRKAHQERSDEALDARKEEYEAVRESATQARLEKEEYGRFEEMDLPPTRDVERRADELAALRSNLDERRGRIQQRRQDIEGRIEALEQHGVPPEVHACIEDLRKEDVSFTPAWDILPRGEDAAYEDALGRARFAILLKSPEDEERAFAVMARHHYPGPVTSLDAPSFVRACSEGWQRGESSFITKVGRFVAGVETPALNESLVASYRTQLEADVAELNTELGRLQRERKEIEQEQDEVREQLQHVKRRDYLLSRRAEWPGTLEEAEHRKQQLEFVEEAFRSADREVNKVEARCKFKRERAEGLDEDLKKVAQALDANEAPHLEELEEAVRTTRRACQDYYEELRSHKDLSTIRLHDKVLDRLGPRLEGQEEPQAEALVGLDASIDHLTRREEDHDRLVAQKEQDVEDARRNHESLEEHRKAQLRAAYRTAKTAIMTLARRVGFEAKLRLDEQDGQGVLYYEIDIRGQGRFEPLKSPRLSTGEKLKGALVFLLGLTNPDEQAFYVFDEPGKNFSPDNVANMYRLFSDTPAQVILTTANEPDYPEEVDVRRYFMGRLVDGAAPAPGTDRFKGLLKVAA